MIQICVFILSSTKQVITSERYICIPLRKPKNISKISQNKGRTQKKMPFVLFLFGLISKVLISRELYIILTWLTIQNDQKTHIRGCGIFVFYFFLSLLSSFFLPLYFLFENGIGPVFSFIMSYLQLHRKLE